MKRILIFYLVLLAANKVVGQVPCDTSANCCFLRYGDQKDSLCGCFFATGQALRKEERYAEAVKQFQVVTRLCPEQNAQTVIDSIYQEHRIWVYKDGRYAIATSIGELITPYVFFNPEPFKNGVAIFYKEGAGKWKEKKYYFVDRTGKVLTPEPGYVAIIPIENGLYYLLRKSQYFSSGIFHSFTDKSGINPKFWISYGDGVENYNDENESPSIYKLSQWSKIDSIRKYGGNCTIKFDSILILENGFLAVKKDAYWGVVGIAGDTSISFSYKSIKKCRNELVWAMNYEGYWGVIDVKGKVKIPFIYNSAHYLGDNRSFVAQESKKYLIDLRGNIVADLKYEHVGEFHENRAIAVSNKISCRESTMTGEGFYTIGFIDTMGHEMINTKYCHVSNFKNGIAYVGENNNWRIIDNKGNESNPSLVQYSMLKSNGPGLRFRINGGINIGKVLGDKFEIPWPFYTPKKYNIKKIHDGLCWLQVGSGKWGGIDSNGDTIIPFQYKSVKNFEEGLAWVQDSIGKWGAIDSNGNTIIPFQYKSAKNFYGGYGLVLEDEAKGWKFIDNNNLSLDLAAYKSYFIFDERIIFVQNEHNFWGVINPNGKEKTVFQYKDIEDFRDGFIWVKDQNLKWGAISKDGKLFIRHLYKDTKGYKDGLAWVQNESGYWGVIDVSGATRITFQDKYRKHRDFHEGLAWVQNKTNKWGAINTNGVEVIGCQYNECLDFQDSLAWVRDTNNSWGAINIDGDVRVHFLYHELKDFKDRYLWILSARHNHWKKDENKWGILYKKNGKVLTAPKYVYSDYPLLGFKEGYAPVRKDSLWGFIDTAGIERIPFLYKDARNFKDGLAWVTNKNDERGAIDMSGVLKIDFEYKEVRDFLKGYAWVNKKDKEWGIIDESGIEVVPLIFKMYEKLDKILDYTEDLMLTSNTEDKKKLLSIILNLNNNPKSSIISIIDEGGNKGILYAKELTFIPTDYQEISYPYDKWVMVMKNGKWGWVDHQGNVMIPCRYDAATPFNEYTDQGYATVFQFDLQFRINIKGEMIWKKE